MKETWKNVVGLENYYQVSSLGRIYSKVKSKIITQRIRLGYYSVGLYDPRIKKQNTHRVHRLVAFAFLSNALNKPQVNHIDGNKFNNTVINLEWVTGLENIRHAHKFIIKHSKGSKNAASKLTETKVKKIGRLLNKGISCNKIAKQYQVSFSLIAGIKRNIGWKHLNLQFTDNVSKRTKSIRIQDNNGQIYNSIYEASKKLKLNKGWISSIIHGRMKQIKGHTFKIV